jgi:DNA primase
MCYTEGCHNHFKQGIIGFVQAVLSAQELGWTEPGDECISWRDALTRTCQILKIDYHNLKPDLAKHERIQFSRKASVFANESKKAKSICTRKQLENVLDIPPAFFLERGYSEEILREYSIGYCGDKTQSLYDRVVVPLFDNDDANSVIGCLGRSIHPECDDCGMYHRPEDECPTDYMHNFVKWKVSKDFNDKQHLFNYWNCKDILFKKRCVVVVEGVPDLLRLREAGIDNCVAVMGASLTDAQQTLFEMSGATSLVCLSDNDDSGNSLALQLKQRLIFQSKFVRPSFETHDVGELSVEYIKKHIKPIIEDMNKK